MRNRLMLLSLLLGITVISSQLIAAQDQTDFATVLEVSPNGLLVAVGTLFGEVRTHDSTTLQILNTLQTNGDYVTDLQWSGSGNKLLMGDFVGHTRIWDVLSNTLIISTDVNQASTDGLIAVAWNADDTRFIAATQNSSGTYVIDAITGSTITLLPSNETYDAAWTPNSNIVTVSLTGLNFWNEAGAYSYQIPFSAGVNTPIRVAYNNTGNKFAIVVNEINFPNGNISVSNEIQIWDVAMRQVLIEFPAISVDVVTNIKWSPDGLKIATGSQDGTIRIWDTTTGFLLKTINSPYPIHAFDWLDNTQIIYDSRTSGLLVDSLVTSTATPTSTPTETPTATPTLSPDIVFVNGIYRAVQRLGDPRVFIERSLSAGMDTFDSPPDGDGWTIMGRTKGADENGVLRAFVVIDGVPYAAVQVAGKGCVVFTPISLAGQTHGLGRFMRVVEQANGLRCLGEWSGFAP